MSRLLLGWDLDDRLVVVVGAGTIAEGKLEVLRTTGARLVVVGPEVTDRVRALAGAGVVELRERGVRRGDVRGAALVIAATDDDALNARVRRWGHRAGAVVNVVDDPARCDVVFPGLVRRGGATIAISTDGASPATASFLRSEIERAIPLGVDHLVEAAAEARRTLRHSGRYRYDATAWRQRLLEPGLAAVREGRTAELAGLVRRFVAGFDEATPIRTGRVTLVGAGPGGVDLITVRGAAALAAADVVVHDRLVDPALLDLAPVVAQRIAVGKSKGCGTSQSDINALLVERAATGAHVVRLKGGDPFVFGRGSEERAAVEAAGIPCEVVPGLTSSVAGPALAGVPVTERGVAASFTVLTGHRIADADHDWAALARSGSTLVVLMAASSAREVAERLLVGGRRGDEPVAVVHRAGSDEQRTAALDLATLAADGSPFPAPCVLVIGPVAAHAGVAASVVSAHEALAR
ncbi:MAG: uroporphyrinogen-III C-methyltransferase [Actinomycetota bacterium]